MTSLGAGLALALFLCAPAAALGQGSGKAEKKAAPEKKEAEKKEAEKKEADKKAPEKAPAPAKKGAVDEEEVDPNEAEFEKLKAKFDDEKSKEPFERIETVAAAADGRLRPFVFDLEATVEGRVDPASGMVVNLADVKGVLRREITARLAERVEELEASAYELAGEEFQLGSTQQLARILFEKLELTAGRKGKTGYSTDARVLRAIRDDHPARHGNVGPDFSRFLGLWWGELLTSLRESTSERS